jgi:hypothetical protein
MAGGTLRCLTVASLFVALTSACSTRSDTTVATSTTTQPTSTSPIVIAQPPVVAAPKVKKWVDLQVGDCLADPPPTDPGVVTVTLVDCAEPHVAEVYSRVPLALNTALADVADRECAEGFAQYTGQSVDGSAFTLTYLIDSNQDRTSDNPNPSAVICLLEGANGPLTASARR